MLTVIELLREHKDLRSMLAWNDDDAVLVCNDDVVGANRNSIAVNGNIDAREAIVANRGGGYRACCVDGKANSFKLRQVTHAAIDDRTGKASGKHRRTHKPTHARDIRAILHFHHIHGARTAGVNRLEHPGQSVRVMVLFFDELHRQRSTGK